MVTYSTETLLAILQTVATIKGHPTFKALWDTVGILLPKLPKIKYPDHPFECMAGMIMKTVAFALVSTRLWQVPERVGEVFHVPRWVITDTDQ